MKIAIIISLLASAGVANAAVFKCESSLGRVEYQDAPCNNRYPSKKLAITQMDSGKVKRAQKKLAIELAQRKALEQQRAEVASKERELRAKELSARAEQDLIYETRKHTEALSENTRAVKRYSLGGHYDRVIYRNY